MSTIKPLKSKAPRKKLWLWYSAAAIFLVCCCVPLTIGALQATMQRVGLLPTFTPRPPTTATPVPAPTLPPTATPAPTRPPLIIDVPAILGHHLAEVEPQFGQPVATTPIGPGSLQSIPEGGETRMYESGKFVVTLAGDTGGIVRWVSVEGLDKENYPLRDHRILLQRLNLDPPGEPNRKAAAAVHWDNAGGLYIGIFSAVDRPINMVNVWQVR